MIFEEAFLTKNNIADNPLLLHQLEKLNSISHKYLNEEIVYCKLSEYLRFYQDGDRMKYEYKYFSRRGRLVSFALMIFIYNDMKFLQPLEDTIWAICDEFTWALPAHLPQDAYDKYRVWIDLFSAETGYALSEIKYLLSDVLSGRVKKRIHNEVHERIIDSFLLDKAPFWWKNTNNNWAAVCSASAAAACMYEGSSEEANLAIQKTEKIMKCFLDGFSQDGICMEGFGYWTYGFGFFIAYAELLRQYTNGGKDYFQNERIKQIAKFLNIAILRSKQPVAFSDISDEELPYIGMSYFLNSKYGDIKLYDHGYSEYGSDHCYRWPILSRNFIWTEYYKDADTQNDDKYGVAYYPDAQWYIKKTPKYILCAKGGNNAEPHNHNDVGSFFLDNHQSQIFTDLGSGEYTRQYFSDRRYDYIVNGSQGHNLPIIDGNTQKAGEKFKADVIAADDNLFKVQLSNAYDVEGLKSFIRSIETKDDMIFIQDEFITDRAFGEIKDRFVSRCKPELNGNKVIIGNVSMAFKNLKCIISDNEYTDHKGIVKKVYFVDFVTTDITGQCINKFVISFG